MKDKKQTMPPMQAEILTILEKKSDNDEKSVQLLGLFNAITNSNVSQMLNFTDWAAKHYLFVDGTWRGRNKTSRVLKKDKKAAYTTSKLLVKWLHKINK